MYFYVNRENNLVMKYKTKLEESLNMCSKYAKRGQKIANNSIALLQKASDDIMASLNETIGTFKENNIRDDQAAQILVDNLSQVRDQISVLPDKLIDDVKILSQKSINITLFGRTMAGKSTLMEILTHGNGMSIGKGYQRTTRDVRDYYYKGISITDVPGIAAFDGETDTRTAFEAAKKADMVLFLITDDAPQPSEAECLQNILSLGKPVLCLVNIRVNLDEKTSLKMFERDINKKMNEERLAAIKKQFLEFGASYGQDWGMLKFEFVHLKAAFLSQQPEWQEKSETLYTLSRFEKVEDMIIHEVETKSGFYKIKSYIDTVVVPLTITADTLIMQAANDSEQYMTIRDKKDKLNAWLKTFEKKGNQRITASLNELKASIRRDVPAFSESYYDTKDAGEKWNQELKKYKIEKSCGEILDGLASDCEEKLREVFREISAELKFNEHVFSECNIEMPKIIDGKKIWGWGVTLVSGGLGVATLLGVPVVGWIALGVGVVGGLLSMLFKSKAKKIAEARKKLENKIYSSLDSQFNEIEKKLQNIFVNELIKKQTSKALSLFDDILKAMKSLSEAQSRLSNELYKKQESINTALLKEAFIYKNLEWSDVLIRRIARISGTCMAFAVVEELPEKVIDKMADIFPEKIFTVPFSENPVVLSSGTTGLSLAQIEIVGNTDTNHFIRLHTRQLSPDDISRIKLAQQLTRLYIAK